MRSKLRRHGRGRRPHRVQSDDETRVHEDLLARVHRASPFPPASSPARRKLEEDTRAQLRALRARKERSAATVWHRIDERRSRV
jgi:hypothetical protein